MEEKQLKILGADKTFFSKISTTISKLLIPTKVGINGMLISIKRNSMLKAYEAYTKLDSIEDANKKEALTKKYEDSFALYLEAIDKYIMESVYKKVRTGTATTFEKNALSEYYTIIHLKEKEYLEYKYKKQKYLLELDYDNVQHIAKDKVLEKYEEFYISKMDSLYKGLLKNYSIKLADNLSSKFESKEETFNKIFDTLEEYITKILTLKIEKDKKAASENILNEYDKFDRFTIGKLDTRDIIEKRMILLAISRELFTHSLPLVVAEQCYIKLLKDTRKLIIESTNDKKQEKAYKMLINLIEDYNIRLLSTKVYWDKPQEREEYKKFWGEFKRIEAIRNEDFIKYEKEKEILFLKYDIKKLNESKKDYSAIKQFYKNKLVSYNAMRTVKNKCRTNAKLIREKIR